MILFSLSIPREGSDFATRLVCAIQNNTPLEKAIKSRTVENRRTAAIERAKQFFLFKCYASAHQIKDPNITSQMQKLKNDLLPPRSISDAETLAACGESIVPYLKYNGHLPAQQRAACVRTLRLIGGPLASQLQESYMHDQTIAVRKELSLSFSDPTTFPGVLEHIEKHGEYPTWIGRNRICSISQLEKLRCLQKLDLSSTLISDIKPLADYTHLESLSLNGTQVSDLSPLTGLNKLHTLKLWHVPFDNLSPISDLVNLQTLELWNTRPVDLTCLTRLVNLQVLNLGATSVTDIRPLSNLTQLKRLNLQFTGVQDLSPLAGLHNLESLDLHGTPVNDLSPLSGLIAYCLSN